MKFNVFFIVFFIYILVVYMYYISIIYIVYYNISFNELLLMYIGGNIFCIGLGCYYVIE